METFKELKAKIESLEKQAEEARRRELAEIIIDIKTKIDEYGITADDLGFGHKNKATKKESTVKAKYMNPETGDTWSGRGKSPNWIQGKKKEDFLI